MCLHNCSLSSNIVSILRRACVMYCSCMEMVKVWFSVWKWQKVDNTKNIFTYSCFFLAAQYATHIDFLPNLPNFIFTENNMARILLPHKFAMCRIAPLTSSDSLCFFLCGCQMTATSVLWPSGWSETLTSPRDVSCFMMPSDTWYKILL